jgi:hypothetical protein
MRLQNVERDLLVRGSRENKKRRVVERTRVWEDFFLSRDKRPNEAQKNEGFAT